MKPYFAHRKQEKLTEQGRKVISPLQTGTITRAEETESKPWKYQRVHVLTLLRHVLQQLNNVDVNIQEMTRVILTDHFQSRFVELNWPLLIPPILALIDDSSIMYKGVGCFDLWTLLQHTPTVLLDRTGLGQVFEEAIMPCLMHFPTLTEETDSILLLNQAYPALTRLACVHYPAQEQRLRKTACLDRIMRYGIFQGFGNAGEHARVAETLVTHCTALIREMGTDAIKHLKVKSYVPEQCNYKLICVASN